MKTWPIAVLGILASSYVSVDSFSCAPPEFRGTTPWEVSIISKVFIVRRWKVCKSILKLQKLKKKIPSAWNEKLHLFQVLENCTFLISGDFGRKNDENPENANFSSERIKIKMHQNAS